MNVHLMQIRGIDDALISLLMSKRSWTLEKCEAIKKEVRENTDENGFPLPVTSEKFNKLIGSLVKWGIIEGHTTLIRYIDVTFVVEGIHRAGQDDLDAHAKRMDNRIVRSSTRLATFSEGEKSEWYQDKIRYPFEAFNYLGLPIPASYEEDGVKFVLTDFGYIRADLAEDKDAKRGLYPLAIPSNFIFKIQYPELSHIYQHRCDKGSANAEVKRAAELMREELTKVFPVLGEYLDKVRTTPIR